MPTFLKIKKEDKYVGCISIHPLGQPPVIMDMSLGFVLIRLI